MKSVRFDRLLASTALGLALVLSCQAGSLQRALAQQSDKQTAPAATVPTPDTTLPPPLTAKDVETKPAQAAAPVAAPEAPKAAAAEPAPAPTAVADSAVSDKLREMVGKLDRSISRKADREGVEAYYRVAQLRPLWVSSGAANDRASPPSPIWRKPTPSASTRTTFRRPNSRPAPASMPWPKPS